RGCDQVVPCPAGGQLPGRAGPGAGSRDQVLRRGGPRVRGTGGDAGGCDPGARYGGAGAGAGRRARRRQSRAVPRAPRRLPGGVGGCAEAQGTRLHACRGLRRGRAQAWTYRAAGAQPPGSGGHALAQGPVRAAPQAAVQHPGDQGPWCPDHCHRRRRRRDSAPLRRAPSGSARCAHPDAAARVHRAAAWCPVSASPGAWTVARVRAAEDAVLARVPESALMRRAAFGLASRTAATLIERTGGVAGRHVALLVGAGNNGGDALWAGAFLRRRGVAVTAVLLSPDRAHPEGLAALRRAGGRTADDLPDRADLVIDGIVGLSGKGPLRPAAARLVDAVRVPIIAVDSPSGVDPDTGTADGPAVTAAETVTFGALKPVHVLAPWRCGRVHLVDIGLLEYLGEPDL